MTAASQHLGGVCTTGLLEHDTMEELLYRASCCLHLRKQKWTFGLAFSFNHKPSWKTPETKATISICLL